MTDVAPIFDETLGEDIAWRIWHLDHSWLILDDPRPELPKFERRVYRQASALWDHDHCTGCTIKFTQAKFDGCLNQGWAAITPGPTPEKIAAFVPIQKVPGGTLVQQPPESTSWLCDDCYRILQDVVQGRIAVKVIGK